METLTKTNGGGTPPAPKGPTQTTVIPKGPPPKGPTQTTVIPPKGPTQTTVIPKGPSPKGPTQTTVIPQKGPTQTTLIPKGPGGPVPMQLLGGSVDLDVRGCLDATASLAPLLKMGCDSMQRQMGAKFTADDKKFCDSLAMFTKSPAAAGLDLEASVCLHKKTPLCSVMQAVCKGNNSETCAQIMKMCPGVGSPSS